MIIGGCDTQATEPSSPIPMTEEELPESRESGNKLQELPEMITITSFPVPSPHATRTIAIAEVIEKKTPMLVQVEPASTEIGRYGPLHFGEAELMLSSALPSWINMIGSEQALGVVQLRRVWNGAPGTNYLMTRATNGIQSPKDLKGKSLPYVQGTLGLNVTHEAILAFAGLTWDDVQKIEMSDINSAQRGVLEGTISACFNAFGSPIEEELAASRHGHAVVELPAADKEGWQRFHNINPCFYPTKRSGIAGYEEGELVEVLGQEYGLVSTPATSADIIYTVCKVMYEGYDIYKDLDAELKNWTWEVAREIGVLPMPYHEGYIMFLKEMGAWTDEHEIFQQNALKYEREILENYSANE